MSDWVLLKKGGIHLHLTYGNDFTNNVFGYDCRFRDKPEFEISFDLSKNLKTRNKQTNTYLDALELNNGEIKNLSLFQFSDHTIFKSLNQIFQNLTSVPKVWKLTIHLGRDWSFVVKPIYDKENLYESLSLHVQ
jgi:hypothetical protein